MIKKNLQQLIETNKEQILSNKKEVERIERKLDLKHAKNGKEKT
ncbi:FbpB family small basic protein [Rossellomorea aquimaris]|nr:FbpB family small basic protein [Rossellomorea aquimaris]MCA1053768.1 FbpB family small basic protein [Rossellomorea aquimaris]